jgi:hypothetical protein
MTARWSDPHRLPDPPIGYVTLAPDQIGAILAVTAVILGLITRSRVSPA